MAKLGFKELVPEAQVRKKEKEKKAQVRKKEKERKGPGEENAFGQNSKKLAGWPPHYYYHFYRRAT